MLWWVLSNIVSLLWGCGMVDGGCLWFGWVVGAYLCFALSFGVRFSDLVCLCFVVGWISLVCLLVC